MNTLKQIYQTPLALLTDLYQLSMAYASWKNGGAAKEAVFDLYFRNNPFGSGYAVAAGLEYALCLMENFRFEESDCEYLRSLRGGDGNALFEPGFIDYLAGMKLSVQVEAVPEGRLVFANEPLLRVTGPLIQCQLLETPLLTVLNFQTLIATKAARIKEAAGGDQVLEFGLRRAQGIDGGITASRAAFIGGADATSNVLAGKLFGIPVRGTHAHSWVMSFDNEKDAFMKFAEAMPNNSVFLVDTYDTLEGVRNAIEAGRWLKKNGHKMAGIRLDSGDLAYLSIEARKLLDEAGFKDATIVASNDLDETIITSLKQQGSRVSIWGVGTKLVTGFDQPALGGVYKLMAIRENASSEWKYRVKLSEQLAKTTTPGIHQVRRYYGRDGLMAGDMIYDITLPLGPEATIVDPLDYTRRKLMTQADFTFEDLLVPVFAGGKTLINRPTLMEIKAVLQNDLKRLHPTIRRFLNPHQYPVGLELGLFELKSRMILERRGFRKGA